MRRNVVKDQFCDECKMECETTGHLFWTCPRAREVWSWSKMVMKPCHEGVHSFQDMLWLWDMVVGENFDVDVIAKFVCIAWAMWQNRNEVRNGGKRRNGRELVSWASQYLEEYKAANVCMVTTTSLDEINATWAPPPVHGFKVNVDGGGFQGSKTAGIGVIIRDDKGRLEAALSKKIKAPLGAVEAEAMAYEAGLLFAKDIGIQDFIVEGDSLVIHQALCEASSPPSSVAAAVQGIQDLCREFRGIEFSHVRRQGNKLTD